MFTVMARTPQHTYQVLTKRPGRMLYFARNVWPEYQNCHPTGPYPWPPNVWAGTSVEDPKYLPRLNLLRQVPAKVRFVRLEPLLEAIDLRPWMPERCGEPCECRMGGSLDWVIVGGESGPNARPMHPDWVRSIRDECQEAGVPFFFKQWGEWLPSCQSTSATKEELRPGWEPENQYAFGAIDGHGVSTRIGKKAAGAMVDGREWREFPDG